MYKQFSRVYISLHYPNPRLRVAREGAWDSKNSEGIRVLFKNSRWGRQLLRFLELSGVGRIVADRTDVEETQMFLFILCQGGLLPRALRTAH